MHQPYFIFSLFISLLCLPFYAQANTNLCEDTKPLYYEKQLFVKSNLIITWNTKKDNKTAHPLSEWISKYNISSITPAFTLKALNDIYLLHFEANSHALITELSDLPFVEYAEKVPIYHSFCTPNDPLYGSQWSTENTNFSDAINLLTGGSCNFDEINCNNEVIIAIVDDAVRLTHEDIAPNLWVNPNEVPGDLIDNDGNGFIDDINGWDAANNDNNPNPDLSIASNSCFTHGTHCAGIAAAATNNATGIASVGFLNKIMAVKCKADGSCGSGIGFAYAGVDYAIASGADVISMSWGGGAFSSTYQALFDLAYDMGIVCVAAAGNDATATPMYPASYNHVISVGATNSTNTITYFSNYGSTIDVMAPGSAIMSSLAGSDSAYGELSGTSMACPYVSGIVGLMRCYDNSLDPDSVEDCLENSAQNIDALNPGFEGLMGAGLVDVFGIVNCLQVPPIADFDVDFSIYCPGETINLNNLTIGPAVDTYNWSFPSGTPTSATSENPSVLYSSAGTYTITLTASNPFGSHTINHDVVVGFPSATLSGSTTTVAGTTVSLQVDYTGSLPYNLIYSDGTSNYTLNNIDENPFFFNITPEVNTTYNLVTVDNGICTTNLNGSAEINVLFVAEGEICSYTSIYGTADNNNITTKAFYDIDNEIIYRGNANADLCAIDASNGNMIWSKNFPELSQKVHGVVKTINNEFMMVSSDAWGSQADWYVYKADANGNLLWAKKYASAGRQLSPKLVASSGDTYFICGWFNTTGSSSDDVGILKIDGDGNILNSMAVHIGGDDQMGEAIGDDNGGLIITGEVEHDRTVFLLHYSANLNLISVQEYAPSLDYYSSGNFAITPTNDGGYAIAVWRNGGGETNLHTTLLKLDANKDVQWARSLFPTVNPTVSAQPYNITQDPSGGIHISGRAFINTGFQSTFFSKYTQNGTYIGTKAPQDPISLGLATSTHGSFITTNPNTPDLPLLIGYDMAESNFGGYDFLITRTSNNYSASACMFMDVNFTAQNETWSRLSSSTSTSTPAFSPINLSSITEDYTLNRTTPCIDCSGSDCALSCSVSASNTSICVGETVVFAPSCSGLSTYLWQIDNETIFSSDPTTSYTFNESGNHTITLYVNDDICTIAEDIIISVGSASASAGSDQSICVGSSANLNASGGSSYVWSPIIGLSNPLIANPVATPSETTTYTVNISDLTSGCSFSDEITVFVNPLPVLPPVTIDTSFCTISDPVSLTLNDLTPISDYTYSWSPTSGLSCSDCASPIANVISSTNYTLTITNALGCENTQTYTISIGTTGLPDASFTPDLADEYCATTGPIPLIPATPGGVFQGEAIFGSTWIPRFVTTLNEPIEISYTVTVNGCTATYVQTVTVIADPDANFTPLMPTYWNTDPAITLIPNETGGTFSSTCGLSGDVFNPASMPLETLCNITYDLNNAACYAAITQYLTVYPCIVPSGLNIINSSAANTLLTWDAVANAESYILQYRPIGTSTWQTSIASSNTHPLTGLDFCTDYEIQIATACGDNWSDFSSLITFTSGGCDLNVQLKVWLEGAYVTSINSMTNTLQNNGFIPLNQPYSTEPWYYTGTESVASVTNLPNYTTDWVLIELRNENDPTILIAQKVGFLLQDGSVVGIEAASTGIVFADVSPGNYYIVVRHRNHLAAMSSAPVLVPNDGAPYDFTSAATQAYGTNQLKQMPNGQYALYTGDINADGIISVADFNLYLDQTANINVYQEADLNLNGQITVTDFNDYLPNASTIGISVIRY